jgi:hypothetical protein
MAKVGSTVQSAFYGRNSHATRESSPTPCREAAQSNEITTLDAAMSLLFQVECDRRGASEFWRSAT